ncbi:ABC transporter substrate-binding protein [Virgibacillus sp. YIM 98842]|uniref:ABC transporter substrate-binding protein n=1 Tax=Virgibacillus sp. YIM 98842 TaxID=2663533 RepID=UPI0013DC9E39|nr:ABC transporter substrate-binding protein [Virgibacillus sp. YIM 98842]
MNRIRQNKYLFILLLITLLLLASCGNNNDENDTPDTETSDNEEITVDSEMGEVTLPAGAERVMAPFHEDSLLALGITPAAKWAIGESVQDYLEYELEDIESIEWSMPLEQVLSHEPELIILENGLDSYEGTYDEYTAISPTYVMTEEETRNWKTQLTKFGEILGKEAEAEQALADYEAKVQETSEALQNILGDETLAMMWVTGGNYFLFEEERHSAAMIYDELGVNVPPLVEELGETEASWDPISLEKLSELDADHVIILGNENDEGIETLENSNVWNNTTAVQDDQVYYIEDESNWTNSGLIAAEQTMDMLIETLQ